jgi:LmbE family N-acetylglucosaminyl deacetylase
MRIMTVYAHPADTITNCGGTLALHADAGDEIVAVIITHGGRIHPNVYAEEARKEDADPRLTAAGRAEIIENKKNELRRAADIIGIGTIEFLDHDDLMSTVPTSSSRTTRRIPRSPTPPTPSRP